MDKMSKLSLLLSTFAVTGLLAGDLSAMSRSEFATVREYVERGDADGLRSFLVLNQGVLDNSPLGLELAAFMQSTPNETLFMRLGLKNTVPASLRAGVERGITDSSIY